VKDRTLYLEDAFIAGEHVISEALPTIVFVARPDGTIEYVNRRWARLTGLGSDRDVTEAWKSVQHPDDRARIAQRWQRSIGTGEEFAAEFRVRTRDGSYRWHLMTAAQRQDERGGGARWYGTLIDIQDRKRLESTQRFLAAATKALTSSLDPAATVRTIAALAIPELADFCDVSLVVDRRLRSVASADAQPPRAIWIRELLARHPSVVLNREFGPGRVLRTMEPEIVQGFPTGLDQQLLAGDERLLQDAARQSVLIVPMITRGSTIGVMTLAFADDTRRYNEDDLAVARELASRASTAIENAEAYEAQRELANELQRALLPTDVPVLDDVVISTYYQPAEAASRIGGDWYDGFRIDANRLAFAVGDVAGHGTQAAMVMREMRQIMRGGLLEGETPLGALRRANRHLLTHRRDMHVTALLAVLDVRTHIMTYANAGHPPLIIRDPSGELAEVGPHGLPLGIDSELEPLAAEVSVVPGSGIVLYTDGLIETDGDLVAGLQRLKSVVSALPTFDRESASEIASRILHHRTHQDDVAVMTVLASH
jgi:PAS domain S-box-containing protein